MVLGDTRVTSVTNRTDSVGRRCKGGAPWVRVGLSSGSSRRVFPRGCSPSWVMRRERDAPHSPLGPHQQA